MYFSLLENKRNILNDPEFSYHFFIKNFVKLGITYVTGRRKQQGTIAGKKILTSNEANQYLYEKIRKENKAPFMAGRYGGTEISQVIASLMIRNKMSNRIPEKLLQAGKINSGIFPKSEEITLRFAEMLLELSGEVDLLVYWGFILMEEYVITKYASQAALFPSRAFEPFQYGNPWTAALKGQRVLVIHPFEDTIRLQYTKRDILFDNPNMLPEFKLLTLKSVQSVGDADCGFSDWFAALEYMYEKALEKDFDVAILGCGAYGFPLAAKLKRAGKKTILLGGLTQLLFGIKGSRWEESRPDIVAMYNENWTRASETERPQGAEKVENAAYW